jgi:hypothetical protein
MHRSKLRLASLRALVASRRECACRLHLATQLARSATLPRVCTIAQHPESIENGMCEQVKYADDSGGESWFDCHVEFVEPGQFFKTRALLDGHQDKFDRFPHPDVRVPTAEAKLRTPARAGRGVRASSCTYGSGEVAHGVGGVGSPAGAAAAGSGRKRAMSAGGEVGDSKRASGGVARSGGPSGGVARSGDPPGVGGAASQKRGRKVSLGFDIGHSGTVI